MTDRSIDVNLLARFRKLPPADRRALWPAAWRLMLVRLLLVVRGYKGTRDALARHSATEAQPIRHPEPWQARTRALQRVSRLLPATRCVARSLTLWWWMRRESLQPQLHIGVARTGDALHGHAWVECDGHLFDETREGAARWSRVGHE